MRQLLAVIVVLAGTIAAARADEPAAVPQPVQAILAGRCLDCHTGDAAEAGVRLDRDRIDWGDPAQVNLWSRVVEVMENRRMPPPDAEPASQADREAIVAFLDPAILAHTSFGGTPPRRLNKAEYETTIRKLLKLPSFHLPVGFPPDTERHGFDNLAEGLVLSPAHLEAYAAVARDVADEIFPPQRPAATPGHWEAGPRDLVLSFAAATVHGDALRLASPLAASGGGGGGGSAKRHAYTVHR